MERTFTTNYGLTFRLTKADNPAWSGYDRSVADAHRARFNGLVCVDMYGSPIDNEYDLDEVQSIVARNL